MSANPAGKVDDQHDYSSQWSAYYRNIGLIREAEAIESEIKHQKSGGMVKKADFSQEWLAFYRKNGLHEQAAEVERQIASKNVRKLKIVA